MLSIAGAKKIKNAGFVWSLRPMVIGWKAMQSKFIEPVAHLLMAPHTSKLTLHL